MAPIRTLFLALLCITPAGVLAGCGDGSASSSGNAVEDALQAALPPRADTPPNVLIFLIDTLRADYVQSYGHPRPTTPHLDAFAQECVQFDAAWANAPNTSPSHASLFTSTYPRTHGYWNRLEVEGFDEPLLPVLSEGAVTLAEAFLENGYDTAGIFDGGYMRTGRGLFQGFDYWHSGFLGVDNRVKRTLKWFQKERDPAKPFFVFTHTYQVHTPFVPDREHLALFADPDYDGPLRKAYQDSYRFYLENRGSPTVFRDLQVKFYGPALPKRNEGPPPQADLDFLLALYEAELHQVDAAFNRLMNYLRATGQYDNTIIVVTSDHGEEFWQHEVFGHGHVYDDTLRVPLLVRLPEGPRGVRRSDNVELLDLMPSLLYQAHVPIPPACRGRILDFTRADPNAAERDMIAEINLPDPQLAWRRGQEKAIFYPGTRKQPSYFRLDQDPGEYDNLRASPAGRSYLEAARQRISAWDEQTKADQRAFSLKPGLMGRGISTLSDADRAELEALGYLDPIEDLPPKEEPDSERD